MENGITRDETKVISDFINKVQPSCECCHGTGVLDERNGFMYGTVDCPACLDDDRNTFKTYQAKGESFRILQNAEDEFIVEKLFVVTETRGMLWWKKYIKKKEWRRCDNMGRHLHFGATWTNLSQFETYGTLEEAKKWIKDYAKYPIYH